MCKNIILSPVLKQNLTEIYIRPFSANGESPERITERPRGKRLNMLEKRRMNVDSSVEFLW